MNNQNDNTNPWERLRARIRQFSCPSDSSVSSIYDHEQEELETKLTELETEEYSDYADATKAITGLMALKEQSEHEPDLSLLELLKKQIGKEK